MLQNVGWASYPERTAIEHRRVDHGGAHILVAESLLNGADVLAPFQQVCRERMAEGVAAGRLGHTGLEDSPLHRPLHHARIEMVAALGTGFPVAPAVLLGKHPFPGHLPASAFIARWRPREWCNSPGTPTPA